MEIKKHLESVITHMRNPKTVTDIAQPKPIRQRPEEYAVPYTVHGILYSNKHLDKKFGIEETKSYIIHMDKFPDDMKPYIYCPVECGGKEIRRKVKRIALSEDDDISKWVDYIDFDKHIEKQVEIKVEDILEAIGVSYSEVMNGQRQTKLMSF